MTAQEIIIAIYAMLMLSNIALLAILWRGDDKRYYRTGIMIWVGFLASFIANALFSEPSGALGVSFALSAIISYYTAALTASLFRIPLPLVRYRQSMELGFILSLTLFVGYDTSFFWTALPNALAAGLTLVHASMVILSKFKPSLSQRLFLAIVFLIGLHIIDYPFLMSYAEKTFFVGFGLGLLLAYLLSVLVPLMISNRLNMDFNHRLRAEVKIKTALLAKKNQELTESEKRQNTQKDRYQNLVRILCHDISNPLTTISFALNIGQKTKNPEHYQRISKATDVITRLIAQVRKEEVETTKAQEVTLEAIDLPEVFNEVSVLFYHPAKRKGITLKVECKTKRQALGVAATFSTVVLSNLVSNSIKFSHPGDSIKLTAHDDKDSVLITVQDEGVGIESKELDDIFNRRSSPQSQDGTSGESGTGFGMVQVASYVESFGGSIQVTSSRDSKDHGTTISIRLKAADSRTQESSPQQEPSKQTDKNRAA